MLPAISVENLGKRYVIEHESRHDNLRDTLHHTARKLWRRVRWGTGFEREEFWALRDISFTVQPGEVLGVIGRNGAGKSTLLKILSRITEPTQGRITLRGRVASLLEVGTGFHPDLTGRENIYLNGAILGMSRAEITRKFDEIVAFAEIERFLDTPVKRYSSGMYVRLAFAVAAHLEPEILIVDEVLAVGDAQFQKKCLGKMQDVARGQGRTVLFVSHQLPVVRQLCSKGLLLDQGRATAVGEISQVVAAYESAFAASRQHSYTRPAGKPASACTIESVELGGENVAGLATFASGSPIRLRITTRVTRPLAALQIGVRVSSTGNQAVFTTSNADAARRIERCEPGRHQYDVELPALLAPGAYRLTIAAVEPHREVFDIVDDCIGFEIDEVGSLRGDLRDTRAGLVEPEVRWTRQELPS